MKSVATDQLGNRCGAGPWDVSQMPGFPFLNIPNRTRHEPSPCQRILTKCDDYALP